MAEWILCIIAAATTVNIARIENVALFMLLSMRIPIAKGVPAVAVAVSKAKPASMLLFSPKTKPQDKTDSVSP